MMLAFLNSLSLLTFISQGHCYLWKPELVWFHVGSDSLIALVYYAIPVALFHFIRKQQDLPSWALLLFATFIIACGTTYLMDIWTLWHPTYWVSGAIKAVTAATALASAVLLVALWLRALASPNAEQLQATNRALEKEIAERQQIEAALRESEEKYRLLFSNELDAVSLFDVETGQLLDVNESFEDLYGYNRTEALQLKVSDISAEPDQSQTAIRIANSIGKAKILLRWHRKKDGTIFPVELCVNRFVLNDRAVMCAVARDITDRQQAEESLKQERELLQTIMDHVPVMLSLIDPQGRIQWVNREWQRILGWQAEDLRQQDLLTELYPDPTYRQFAHEAIQAATGKWQDFEIRTRNGTVIDTAWANVRLSDGRNIGIGQDITERKAAEVALRESEERFRQITETMQEVFWVTTTDLSQVLYVSPAYEVIWGRTCASLYEQPKSFMDAIHPSDRDRVLALITTQRYSNFSHEYRIIKADGSVRWIWERAFAVRDEAGNPYRLIGVSQDITDRKLAEEALRLADFSFDRSAVAAVWISKDARILRVNEGACQMLGYSREELQSMYVYDLDPNFPQATWSEHWEMLRQQKTLMFESQLQAKDGNFIPISTTLNYLEFNGEEYNFAFAKDISEQLRAEAALRQQTERERLLVSVTEHIRRSLDLEKVLNTAVAEVRRLLQSDRVVIYRLHEDWSGTIVAESARCNEISILGQFIHDPCFAKDCYAAYQQGRVSSVEDIETTDIQPCYQQLLKKLQVRANLIVPILHDTTLWGLLVAHYCFEPHIWQPWEIDSLRQLTAQLAIAIQQSELYRQVQRFNAYLEQQVQERTEQLKRSLEFEALLKRITDKVRDSLDEAYILQTAVQELALGLRVYSCDSGLYDLEQNISTIHYEYVRCELPSAKEQPIQLSDFPELYTPLLQGATLQFSWLPDRSNSVRPVVKHFTALACPLIDDQAVIGDLWLYKAGEQCFEELEVRLVQQVANQCAIAVRQARLYQAAQAQVKELERLNHLKDDFLSTVSHELRTPMSNIKMATQMLEIILTPLGVLDPDTCVANRYFQILQDECQRETSLINDLLDLSRLESSVEPLEITSIDLRFWVPHILEPFEARIRTQQQDLQLDLPEQLPCLETDLSYLEKILTELLNNACKYTPAHERILISARVFSDQLELSIRNSGVEISASELPHIFEKFYRVPSHDPWKHGGTGLGLALVERRVKQLKGTITATSEQGWTAFVLTFPLKAQAL